MEDKGKVIRVLDLYNKFMVGEPVNKAYEATRYGVNEKSIQRDIEDIRAYLERQEMEGKGIYGTVVYDRIEKAYRLEKIYDIKLSNSEVLAICKILLDARAFPKNRMDSMIDKLIDCCVPKVNQKIVKELVANEKFHYIEPQHRTDFLDRMWTIGQAIRNQNYIEISYYRLYDKKNITRKVKPAALMFSEFYFYVTAFIEDEETKSHFVLENDSNPTIYRIDRIQKLKVLDEKFHVLYHDRFEEGEFRKRVQFMFSGRLRKIKFKYSGYSLEAVLDRLPTARILAEENGVYTISAEVFGDGVDMWIRAQGNVVEVME